MVNSLPADGWEAPLEEEMATHSSIFAWKIPWTEEPGGLHSMESQMSQTRLSDETTTKTQQARYSNEISAMKVANV